MTRAMSRVGPILCLVVLAAALAGCGGAGGGRPPDPVGNTTLRGKVTIPAGQSVGDVVVRVAGTGLQARPGPDGTFEIRGVPEGVRTVSAVSAATNMGAHVSVTVAPSGEVVVPELRLFPGGQIAGIVTAIGTDGNYHPVADAAITVRPAGEVVIMQDGVTMPPPRDPAQPPVDTNIVLEAKTDDQGTYALKGVPAGAYTVVATVSRYDPLRQFIWVSAGHTTPADFAFGEPPRPQFGKVVGVVTGLASDQTTVPVAGAMVWVDLPTMDPATGVGGAAGTTTAGGWPAVGPGMPETRPDGSSILPVPGVSAITDENGRYTLDLPVGRWTVQCRHRDYYPTQAEVDVRAQATSELNFTLRPVPGERPRLKLTGKLDATVYRWGAPIDMRLSLENVGTVPVTLSFDGHEAHFAVWQGDRVVWTYGGFGPMPLENLRARSRETTVKDAVLDPGDIREYRVSWDQRGWDGSLVDPGRYSFRGTVYAGSAGVIEAEPVPFAIESAATTAR